jgi:mannitol/fructose-specific phosphotransferase system IIA component (Ntr-type)
LLAQDLIGFGSDSTPWIELARPLDRISPNDNVESALRYFQGDGATICAVQDKDMPLGIVTIEDVMELVIGRTEDHYSEHVRVDLCRLIITDSALLDLSSATSEEAIREMASHIPAELVPRATNLADLAIAREREVPTCVGMGVALPHARCENLTRPIIVFGRSPRGIVFDEQSSETVHLILLMVTPADLPSLQIQLLSQITSVVADADIRQRLREAAYTTQVQEIFAAADDATALDRKML